MADRANGASATAARNYRRRSPIADTLKPAGGTPDHIFAGHLTPTHHRRAERESSHFVEGRIALVRNLFPDVDLGALFVSAARRAEDRHHALSQRPSAHALQLKLIDLVSSGRPLASRCDASVQA
jgi:hypothetical protein